MLTVITLLKTFRFRLTDLEKKIDLDTSLSSLTPCFFSHVHCMEIEAMLRNEQYNRFIIEYTRIGLLKDSEQVDQLTFVCSDGEYEYPYSKYTLARHSILIRDFVSDFPEADRIDMNRHTVDSIKKTMNTILGFSSCTLSPELIYALQTLNPPSDLYYLLFTLPASLDPSFLINIINNMLPEEREHVQYQYNMWNRYHPMDEEARDLPDRGRGLAIGFAFSSICDYLSRKDVPEFYKTYPSYVFYLLSKINENDVVARNMLLSIDFCDDAGILDILAYDHVCEIILNQSTTGTWKEFCIIMGMLGVRHSLLGNEGSVRLAPYQVTLRSKSIAPWLWTKMSKRLDKISEIEISKLNEMIRPYLR